MVRGSWFSLCAIFCTVAAGTGAISPVCYKLAWNRGCNEWPDDVANGLKRLPGRPFGGSYQEYQPGTGQEPYRQGDGGTAMNHHSGFNKNFLRPLILSLVLLLTGSGFAQTIDSPSSALNQDAAPKRGEQEFGKKIFWTEVGAYTLFNVLDGYTTIARPTGYEEAGFPRGSSFLLGKNPSAGRYVSTMGVMQVATSFAA